MPVYIKKNKRREVNEKMPINADMSQGCPWKQETACRLRDDKTRLQARAVGAPV
jgi:hypothetical protein